MSSKATTPNLMSSRRQFFKSAAILGSFPFVPASATDIHHRPGIEATPGSIADTNGSIIGQFGSWASSLRGEGPPELSFRGDKWKDVENWRQPAMNKLKELVACPKVGRPPKVTVHKKYNYDGLAIEELSWQLSYGRPTEALLLKPENANEPLPAIVGLHDHGGNKYLGKRKITRTSDELPDFIAAHQEQSYEGLAWANELAKRGYVVLVHDTFTFGSRRVMYQDIAGIDHGICNVDGKSDEDPENPDNIDTYNEWAGAHEHIMAKSLFCAGTTWPGVTLAEDQAAVDVLVDRPDVDSNRLGCAGLSGGGLRTVYLGGMDHRLKCAVAVGFMSTWDDFLLNKSYTHTWMTYAPLLSKYLEFPEILGLRVPLPTMVLNDINDSLYTMPEMTKADEILKQVFKKAGAEKHYRSGFYPGPHKFDKQMQADAFEWFDLWLNS